MIPRYWSAGIGFWPGTEVGNYHLRQFLCNLSRDSLDIRFSRSFTLPLSPRISREQPVEFFTMQVRRLFRSIFKGSRVNSSTPGFSGAEYYEDDGSGEWAGYDPLAYETKASEFPVPGGNDILLGGKAMPMPSTANNPGKSSVSDHAEGLGLPQPALKEWPLKGFSMREAVEWKNLGCRPEQTQSVQKDTIKGFESWTGLDGLQAPGHSATGSQIALVVSRLWLLR